MIIPALLVLLAQTPTQAPDFTGLWEATLRFGPDVRGNLIIYRTPDGWRADIAGFTVIAQQQGQSFSFELPDGKGALRDGHWIAGGFATPVVLVRDGADRYHANVAPLDSRMTFYMPVARKPDGSYATYLRNPERNQGRFIRAQRIEFDDQDVKLIGTGGRPDGTLSIGRYYDDGVIRLPLRGGTYDFTKVTDSSSSPFYPRGKPAPRYQYNRPLQTGDGWPVATLEEVGISRDSIAKFVQSLIDMTMDSLPTLQIHSLLIARHGKLVLEEYFHGYNRDIPHDTRSASKSWTATLLGAAMQAGIPLRLDMPVYATMGVATDDPRKRAMTLEHLITMTAGFNCDPDDTTSADEDVMDGRAVRGWYRYTMNVALVSTPGEKIFYCSTEPNLAGGMLAKVAGEPQIVLFRRLLADPLKLSNYHLFTRDGDLYGGGGSRFTPRDFAKLAQLMLNEGRWNGKQILSRDWVRRSGAPLRDLGTTQQYGYLWNSQELDYRGRKVRAVFAGGNGGQVSMAIPDLDLVIAFTGGNYGTRGLNPQPLLGAVQ